MSRTRRVAILFIISLLCLTGGSMGQRRYLVTPHDEMIPMKRGQTASMLVARQAGQFPVPSSATCGTRFSFGYPPDKGYPPATEFFGHHKDVFGEWFVAKASGSIDTIFWLAGSSIGALDSTVYLRIHKSRIGPDYGPGARPGPWPPPCQNWGYFLNTNDLDQGVAAFPDDATPPDTTTWHSTIASGPPTRPPFLNSLWGFGGFALTMHPNTLTSVAMADGGQSLNVTAGDRFFVSLRVKGGDTHPVPDDAPTNITVYFAHVDSSDENYPSRDWKFYEHDSGPTNCAGVPTDLVKRGWVARGGAGDTPADTFDIGMYNIWYSMTVTTNVPPDVLSTDAIQTTFDTGPQIVSSEVIDCDPPEPGRAGVKKASLKWQINGAAQPDIPMTFVGGSTFEGTIPGQPPQSQVTYKVYAEDSTGQFAYGTTITYRVLESQSAYAQIDTSGTCVSKDIHGTGTTIPASSFYVPPSADAEAQPKDDGTAGPFDLGSAMPLFGTAGRYVWVGVNGAIALSQSATDTVDVNKNGHFDGGTWTFPYNGSLRHGGRSDSLGGFGPSRMPGNFIAPLWEDLWYGDAVTTCGHIRVQKGYSGDTCQFIVEWDSIGAVTVGGTFCDQLTFRLVLNKCDGTIEYQYDDMGGYGAETAGLIGFEADSNSSSVPNPGLNKQPPYLILNESGFPIETRPRNGWCIRLFPATVSTSIAGWNMLSVGVAPVAGDYTKSALYPAATTQAFAYAGNYVARPTLKNGEGYWMKFGAGQNVGARGGLLHSVTDSLKAGWNMIGTIGFNVPIGAVTVSGTTLTSPYYGYNGSYVNVNATTQTLKPGLGYWVKSSGVGALSMNGDPSAEPKNIISTNYAELNSITIRDNTGRAQTLYLGSDQSVKEPLSYHEMPPAAPEFDARFASGRMVETYPVHLTDKAIYSYAINIDASAYPLSVSWNIVNPAERKMVLSSSDGKLGNTVMDGTGTIRLTNANVKSLTVTLQDIAVPKSFALGQNYPNPFNPSTRFTIEIPRLSEVNVTVYDILGRQIATLLSGEQGSGYHSVEWDGLDSRGISVPTGVYFVRMKAGRDFSATRKIALLK